MNSSGLDILCTNVQQLLQQKQEWKVNHFLDSYEDTVGSTSSDDAPEGSCPFASKTKQQNNSSSVDEEEAIDRKPKACPFAAKSKAPVQKSIFPIAEEAPRVDLKPKLENSLSTVDEEEAIDINNNRIYDIRSIRERKSRRNDFEKFGSKSFSSTLRLTTFQISILVLISLRLFLDVYTCIYFGFSLGLLFTLIILIAILGLWAIQNQSMP